MRKEKALTEQDLEQIGANARRLIDVGIKFKQTRLREIEKSIDAYNNKVRPAMRGRFNIPVPVMGGYVDTMLSMIDDPVTLHFDKNEEGDARRAKKVQAAWDKDSAPDRGNWNSEILAGKQNSLFSGRAIHKYFAESIPEYRSILETPDWYDFFNEPMGGGDLEKHYFLGQCNIFRMREELADGARNGTYDRKQVGKLIGYAMREGYDYSGTQESKYYHADFIGKINRLKSIGIDPQTYQYVGQDVFPMAEVYLTYKGKRYYVFLDMLSGLWIRIERLKDIFGSDRWPFVSWATHYDKYNFWSKAPCDDFRPVSEAIQLAVNQAFDSVQRRNWPQIAYDTRAALDPSKFEWRPHGLVPVRPAPNHDVKGSFSVIAPDADNVQITLNLVEFFENFVGRQTAVTNDEKGNSKEQRVGVYVGNQSKAAGRMGLTNRYFSDCLTQLGIRYREGLAEHMPESFAVKLVGLHGAYWDEVTKDDVNPNREFTIRVTGGNTEAQLNAQKKTDQMTDLTAILPFPEIRATFNPKALAKMVLERNQEPETVRVLLDKDSEANEEMQAEAADCIQQILEGKKPELYVGADTQFYKRIIDEALKDHLTKKQRDTLVAFAEAHKPIINQNMIAQANIQALQMQRAQLLNPMGAGAPPAGGPAMNPGKPQKPGKPQIPGGGGMPGMPSAPMPDQAMQPQMANAMGA